MILTSGLLKIFLDFKRYNMGKALKYKEGYTYVNKQGLEVIVVEYISKLNILVKFTVDGLIVKTRYSAIKNCYPIHPNYKYSKRILDRKGIVEGKMFKTNSGWDFTIEKYENSLNVHVLWQDGSRSIETMADIKKGSIKPLNQPSVEGIGYFGVGRFVPSLYRDGEKVDPRIYAYWVRMFSRCYNPFELNKDKNSKYRDIHICKEWHNFQNFAEWAIKQKNNNLDFELDKDLLSNNTKIYSPETCCFIPIEINLFLIQQDVGNYYRGVNVVKPKLKNSKIGYIARCSIKGKREYLGFYNTPEEAFAAYKNAKENYAKELAAKWKDFVDIRVTEALLNYTVE